MYWVYILECADGSLYTGVTTDVRRRFAEHLKGDGAKYTRSHRAVRIVYRRRFTTRSRAQREEAAIKKLPRSGKLMLIKT